MTGAICGVVGGVAGGGGGGSITGDFAVTITPALGVSRIRTGRGNVTTPAATAAPGGGAGPYTYAWTMASGSPAFTITTPTAAATTFSIFLENGDFTSGTAVCTVTDSGALVGVGYVTVKGISSSNDRDFVDSLD